MKWSCLAVVMVVVMMRREEGNNNDQPVSKPVILPPVYRKYGAQRNKMSPRSGSSHCKLVYSYFSLLLTLPSGLIHWLSTASVSKPALITDIFSPPRTEGSSGFENVWWFYLLQRLTLSLPQVCAATLVLPPLFFSYKWSSNWVLVNECDWKWCALLLGLMH